MSVLINFKICDNSRDCSGITACPSGAFFWDEKKKTIAVDNSICTSCGACEKACPVGAIRVAKNDAEYKKIRSEISKDPRMVSDLFVDRYGTQPISPAFQIPVDKFDVQIIQSTKPAVVELFNNGSIMCLLNSIPVKDLFKGADIKYRKIEDEDGLLAKRYKVKVLPSLLFFRDCKLTGKIEGYYSIRGKKELLAKVKKLI